jgi:hypothetical protein
MQTALRISGGILDAARRREWHIALGQALDVILEAAVLSMFAGVLVLLPVVVAVLLKH